MNLYHSQNWSTTVLRFLTSRPLITLQILILYLANHHYYLVLHPSSFTNCLPNTAPQLFFKTYNNSSLNFPPPSIFNLTPWKHWGIFSCFITGLRRQWDCCKQNITPKSPIDLSASFCTTAAMFLKREVRESVSKVKCKSPWTEKRRYKFVSMFSKYQNVYHTELFNHFSNSQSLGIFATFHAGTMFLIQHALKITSFIAGPAVVHRVIWKSFLIWNKSSRLL